MIDTTLEPPSEATGTVPFAPDPGAVAPKAKSFSETIRLRLVEFLKVPHHGSMADFAKQIGRSPTALSLYINKKPQGDVATMESEILEVLNASAVRKDMEFSLFKTTVSQDIFGLFNHIKNTADMGFISGDSGVGKTCSAHMICAESKLTVLVTVKQYCNSGPSMCKALFDATDHRGWNSRIGTRGEWVEYKFEGSRRLIIVDDCHELAYSGIKFFRHFHEYTRCPMMFLGNRSFLKKARVDPQFYTRLGLAPDLKPDTTQKNARGIVEQFAPGTWDEINPLAIQVLSGAGHGRSLRKQILLAQEIKRAGGADTLRDAFIAAHSMLLRDKPLNIR